MYAFKSNCLKGEFSLISLKFGFCQRSSSLHNNHVTVNPLLSSPHTFGGSPRSSRFRVCSHLGRRKKAAQSDDSFMCPKHTARAAALVFPWYSSLQVPSNLSHAWGLLACCKIKKARGNDLGERKDLAAPAVCSVLHLVLPSTRAAHGIVCATRGCICGLKAR